MWYDFLLTAILKCGTWLTYLCNTTATMLRFNTVILDYTYTSTFNIMPAIWFNHSKTWLVTFAICRYKTSFLYVVSKNSSIPLNRSFYTMYTAVEISPMVKLSCLHHGWKFIHNFYIVNLSHCCYVAIFQNYYFTNILYSLSTCGERNMNKVLKFIAVAQKLKELQIFRWICG